MNHPGAPGSPDTARPGRPRSARADQAILEATISLLAEEGYRALAMEGVAAQAGVGKSTLYRRWSSKAELVIAAMGRIVHEVEVPDTGDVRRDLAELLHGVRQVMSRPLVVQAITGLVGEAAVDLELRQRLREVTGLRRQQVRELLARGVERGELRPDIDLDVLLDLLVGPLYTRMMITGGPLDEPLVEGLLDLLWRGIGPPD